MYPVSAAYRHAMRRQVRDQGYVRLQFGIFDASAPGTLRYRYRRAHGTRTLRCWMAEKARCA